MEFDCSSSTLLKSQFESTEKFMIGTTVIYCISEYIKNEKKENERNGRK